MRRGLLVLSTVLISLAGAPAASANQPTREIHPSQDDVVFTDQCAFPVRAHVQGKEIITTFTDREGNVVKQIVVFPGNTLTLTNLDTGASITVVATGSFQGRLNRDGSITFMVTGHGPFVPNPITGAPGIWYLTGRARATVDADGNQTSVEIVGTLVDLCAQLGS